MELWFTEKTNESVALSLLVKNQLYHGKTAFQTIDVLDTVYYGKLLVIDRVVMLTEKDEFIYHELISHIPLQFIEHPERVLIIGGGDGGTAREVLKYPTIQEVMLVEIDRDVIDVCREFFPEVSSSFSDPRMKVVIADGAEFVKNCSYDFDLIIVDSTDPVGPGKVLFSEEFYRDCAGLLKPSGILTAQTESPFDRIHKVVVRDIYRSLSDVFNYVRMYLGSIPTYPFGLWSFAFCSQDLDPCSSHFRADYLPPDLNYYNRDIGKSVFNLPNFVREIIHE